jgi:hypothetical protein
LKTKVGKLAITPPSTMIPNGGCGRLNGLHSNAIGMAVDATTASVTAHVGVSLVEDDEALPVQVDGDDVELNPRQSVELLERDAFATTLPTQLADVPLEYVMEPIGKRVLIQVARTVAYPKRSVEKRRLAECAKCLRRLTTHLCRFQSSRDQK